MPSMIESVVMRKCNVSYKQSKQIVAMARDFLRLSADSSLLWSKELENACILVYNNTNCEETAGVNDVKSIPVEKSKRSLQKTKSGNIMNKYELERPLTKERKARSLSKSRTRKTSKSTTTTPENHDPQVRSTDSRERLATSSSHGRSTSRIRRFEEVLNDADLMKSARKVHTVGELKEVRSSRPQRSRSEKSCNSKTSDRSQSSKSPSSSSSQRSKSRLSRNLDHAVNDVSHVETSNGTTSSERLMDSEKNIKRPKAPQSTSSINEVRRRPRSSSESSDDREKYCPNFSRAPLSTLATSEHEFPIVQQKYRSSSETRRPQCSSSTANSCEKSAESPSSRSTRTENDIVRKKMYRKDSGVIEKRSHHQSSPRGYVSKHSSLDMKFERSRKESKTNVKRSEDNEESWIRSLSVSSRKKLPSGSQKESTFLGSDDESSSGSFACSSKPSNARKVLTTAIRRPRSPGPRIGANSDCATLKKMPLLTMTDKSNHSIRSERSTKHISDDQANLTGHKKSRKSVSPAPGLSSSKNHRISPSSPKILTLPLVTNSPTVVPIALTNKKSAVSRRRLSMEELEKACEADPGLRDAIVANLGRDSGGIRLGTYRPAPKSAVHGDEFVKSFEEWEEHNDDSSESTHATSKLPALQQYTLDNPLSTFIGKRSNKSISQKDENTVSTGSESSTRSKTRMIPVVKSTTSPAKKTFPKGCTMKSSSSKPSRIVKNTSNLTLMSTDFEDPFIAKKKEATKPRNRFIDENFVQKTPNASKAAGCSVEESVLSRTSNTTEATCSSSKDDSEEDIPIVDYTTSSFHDEYTDDQIFPEFSERFAKSSELKRKDSVRVSSGKDSQFACREGNALSSTKRISSKSALGPPKLPQRKLSMIGSLR